MITTESLASLGRGWKLICFCIYLCHYFHQWW